MKTSQAMPSTDHSSSNSSASSFYKASNGSTLNKWEHYDNFQNEKHKEATDKLVFDLKTDVSLQCEAYHLFKSEAKSNNPRLVTPTTNDSNPHNNKYYNLTSTKTFLATSTLPSASTHSGHSFDQFDCSETFTETLNQLQLTHEIDEIFEEIEYEQNLPELQNKLRRALFWHKKQNGDIQYLKDRITEIENKSIPLIQNKHALEKRIDLLAIENENLKKEKEIKHQILFEQYSKCLEEKLVFKQELSKLKKSLENQSDDSTQTENEILKSMISKLEEEKDNLLDNNSALNLSLHTTQAELEKIQENCSNEHIGLIEELIEKNARIEAEKTELTRMLIENKTHLAWCESKLSEMSSHVDKLPKKKEKLNWSYFTSRSKKSSYETIENMDYSQVRTNDDDSDYKDQNL